MSKKRTVMIVIVAFLVGVIAACSAILILSKREISGGSYEDETDYMGTVVIDGYEIRIPNQYKAAVDDDDLGLVYSDNGTFEMSISVLDASYDSTVRELDSLDESLCAWAKLMEPFRELAVGQNAYIYGVYEDEGDIMLLAYRKANEEQVFKMTIAEIVDVRDPNATTEETTTEEVTTEAPTTAATTETTTEAPTTAASTTETATTGTTVTEAPTTQETLVEAPTTTQNVAGNQVQGPKTGDNAPVYTLLIVSCMSLAAATVLYKVRKRR